MGSIFKPKMPSPPPLIMPEENDVPCLEDEARAQQAEEDERRRNRNKVGRRQTILTGSQGLNDIADEDINKKTLLGG